MDDFNEKERLDGVDGEVPEEEISEEASAEETPVEETPAEEIGESFIEENAETAEEPFEDGVAITPDDGEELHYTEEDFCILCGERLRDTSIAPDYDLCSECRMKLAKTPVKFIGLVVIILLLGACYWAGFLSYQSLDTVQAVIEGDRAAEQNLNYTAINAYAGVENGGAKTAKKLVETAYKCGYLSLINETVEGEFSEYELSLPWNKSVKTIYDDYNNAMKSYEKAYAVIGDVDEALYYGEMTYDKVEYDKLISELDALKTDETTDEDLTFIAYCKYYLTTLCQKGSDIEEKYLLEVKQLRPDYKWLYLRALVECEVNLGNNEEVTAICAELRAMNAEDYYADYYEARSLRMSGSYDEAIEKALNVEKDYDQNGFGPVYYELAALYMLKGDNKKAYDYASIAFDEYLTIDSCNIYALLCKLNGDSDGYDKAVSMLSEHDYKLSDKVQQYLDGKLDAKTLFKEGEGNF